MASLGAQLREEAVLRTLTEDVLQTCDIEGEVLDQAQVRSSLARRLGLDIAATVPADSHIVGIVEVILDATRHHSKSLDDERLFAWHSALFPTGRSGMTKITVGAWRGYSSGPMQIVSGPIGREKVHYQAPTAAKLVLEMKAFLGWFNADTPLDPVLKAGIAHFWFVTIHPFDDGNGRIARAIADLMLARSEGSPQRFYSMSAQIRHERGTYYDMLERTQKGGLDITPWLMWFLGCLDRAFDGAELTLTSVLRKARFWEQHSQSSLNERQRLMLNRLLDGFEGKLTSSKWAKLAKCSQDTAHRDIDGLVRLRALVKERAAGRSTSYAIVDD